MRIQLNKEKTGVLMLSALVIALVLALPRLVIILYVKSNSDGAFNSRAGGAGFLLRIVYTYIIAVLFLWINTSRQKFILKPLTIDLGRFYQRMIINILLFAALRFITTQYNLHSPAVAVGERFYDFISNITLILEIILCILVSEIYLLMVSNQQIRLRNETLQKANAEATFEVLKNQVNPHFLFNSLNTINAMIGNRNDAAKAFVNNMAKVYRHVLSSINKPVVTLEEEMEVANAYIKMLQERHGENLTVEVTADSKLMTCLLPPMSLQILLENAVKHSVISARQPLLIKMEAKDMHISVVNTIQEKRVKPPSTGTGLYNLNQRYWHLCKKEIDISRTDSEFKVILPLLKVAEVQGGN